MDTPVHFLNGQVGKLNSFNNSKVITRLNRQWSDTLNHFSGAVLFFFM